MMPSRLIMEKLEENYKPAGMDHSPMILLAHVFWNALNPGIV
jgi:hypothetical protein